MDERRAIMTPSNRSIELHTAGVTLVAFAHGSGSSRFSSRNQQVARYLNEQARERMRTHCELTIVPGATHLFEEPGTLDEVQSLAGGWFREHL